MNRWKVHFWNGHEIKAVVVDASSKDAAIARGRESFPQADGWVCEGAYTL